MKNVVVLNDAAQDLENAREFYNDQQLGIGSYFVDSLLSDIESLSLLHGIRPRHFGFLRMLASRFPFGVYYQETPHNIQVFAVLDLRRNPSWIRTEISERSA